MGNAHGSLEFDHLPQQEHSRLTHARLLEATLKTLADELAREYVAYLQSGP